MKTSLLMILVVGICGLLFSGYLSYMELFAEGCGIGCSDSGSGLLFGVPVCVYGFIMYLSIVIMCIFGLFKRSS